MLDLVGFALEAEKIQFQRLDGTMSLKQRERALETFRTDPECIVLLASIQCAGVG